MTGIDITAVADSFIVPAETDLVVPGDRGSAEACNDHALMFLEARLDAEAIDWLCKGAADDHVDAMHWLVRSCVEGRGVPKDVDLCTM